MLRDTRFRDVDGSGDPADQVAYLEAVSGLDGARAYKRRSFETLRVRPGARILDVGCGTGEDLRELAGLVRVAHRGARVVVCDTDWGSLLVAGADKELTRTITEFRCDLAPNGWVGRQLPGLARMAGLTDLTIEPATWVSTDLAVSDALLDLSAAAERAEDEGVCPPGAAAAWVAQLRQAVSDERFLTALTLFVVCGQKP